MRSPALAVRKISALLLLRWQEWVPMLNPVHGPVTDMVQAVMAPSVSVIETPRSSEKRMLFPVVHCPVMLLNVPSEIMADALWKVPLTPAVSKSKVTDPVRLVPKAIASASALGLGTAVKKGDEARMVAVSIVVNGLPA